SFEFGRRQTVASRNSDHQNIRPEEINLARGDIFLRHSSAVFAPSRNAVYRPLVHVLVQPAQSNVGSGLNGAQGCSQGELFRRAGAGAKGDESVDILHGSREIEEQKLAP